MFDDLTSTQSLLLGTIAAFVFSYLIHMFFSKSKLQVDGQHVYITGASQGLGLAAACQLAARGAHITIVARRQPQLDAAVKEIKSYCRTGSQRVNSISADLSQASSSDQAFQRATDEFGQGKAPDVVVCAAGMAGGLLGLFADDLQPDQLERAMSVNYFTAAYTAMAAAKRMTAQKVPGKIVFVSSTVGFISFAGYSAYAPAKAAIRSLADTLRNELLPHRISVHLYAPGTMHTPGYDLENESKPQVTKVIEGPDEGCSAEYAAQRMIKGLEAGHFFIFSDPFSQLFATATSGASPRPGFLRDAVERFVAWIVFPIWRRIIDSQSRAQQQ